MVCSCTFVCADHVNTQFALLLSKFGEFKRPRDFETRVGRVRRLVDDVQSSVELLRPSAVTSGDSRAQLDRCEVSVRALVHRRTSAQELETTMRSLSPEVQALIAAGERLAGEGMLDRREDTLASLHALRTQYNQLASDVAEHRWVGRTHTHFKPVVYAVRIYKKHTNSCCKSATDAMRLHTL